MGIVNSLKNALGGKKVKPAAKAKKATPKKVVAPKAVAPKKAAPVKAPAGKK